MGKLERGIVVGIAAAAVMMAFRQRRRKNRATSFSGKVALITGGSRGLGLELARRLANEEAKVAICARDLDELERAKADLEARGADVLILPIDVTDPGHAEEIARSVEELLGPIDILINNAGVIQVGPMDQMRHEDYEEAMRLHFWAPLYLTEAVVSGMRERRAGRIVNIASIGGKIGVPHLLPYCSSKFALVGFTEGLRAELAEDGIYVTCACPGLMRTGSHVHAKFKGQQEKEYTWFSIGNATPLLSISSGEAAEIILNACRHGDAEVIFPLSARIGTLANGLVPGLTQDVMAIVNRLLPGPEGGHLEAKAGAEVRPENLPSFLTGLSDEAIVPNNELPAT